MAARRLRPSAGAHFQTRYLSSNAGPSEADSSRLRQAAVASARSRGEGGARGGGPSADLSQTHFLFVQGSRDISRARLPLSTPFFFFFFINKKTQIVCGPVGWKHEFFWTSSSFGILLYLNRFVIVYLHILVSFVVPFQGVLNRPPTSGLWCFCDCLIVITGSGGGHSVQPLLLLLCDIFKYILFFLFFNYYFFF